LKNDGAEITGKTKLNLYESVMEMGLAQLASGMFVKEMSLT